MIARQNAQDVIANNIANANTSGFKADRPVFSVALNRSVNRREGDQAQTIGSLAFGSRAGSAHTANEQGALMATGNPLDFAVSGPGYFVVETPQGERYTRNGSFMLDAEGRLVDKHGHPVKGEQGEISIPAGKSITVAADGTISVEGQTIDKIQIVDGNLRKNDQGRFVGQVQPVESPIIAQGALEASNVSVVKEMISMIENFRAFEASQKVLKAHDDALGLAVNELAKL